MTGRSPYLNGNKSSYKTYKKFSLTQNWEMIKIYANKSEYSPDQFQHLPDILQFLWADQFSGNKTSEPGSAESCFTEVDDIASADLCLLPYKWNFYVDNHLEDHAQADVMQASRAQKPVVLFSTGDHKANLPFQNTNLFEQSAYRSRRNQNGNQTFAFPAFIYDYLKIYCPDGWLPRRKNSEPVVGFCGQAGGSPLDFIRRWLFNKYQKFRYRMGFIRREPAPYETTILRKKILSFISASRGVKTNFLIRARYRAGYLVQNKDLFHPTRLEFINNILGSDYTVCVRGQGNFSVRFYETLALGRIPVFVDTDCLLPHESLIDYRKYCVWVAENEIHRIGEKILEFHQSLSEKDFIDLQRECHNLWLNYLSKDGFYRNFSSILSGL